MMKLVISFKLIYSRSSSGFSLALQINYFVSLFYTHFFMLSTRRGSLSKTSTAVNGEAYASASTTNEFFSRSDSLTWKVMLFRGSN